MSDRGWNAVAVLLAISVVASGWKAANAAGQWWRAPDAAELTGTVKEVRRAVGGTGPLAAAARARRAIVFVYAHDCSASNAGMWSWMDVVREARHAPVELLAVTPVESATAQAYWDGLERHVRVLAAPPAEVHGALGVGATPATLLVENGEVRGEILGALTGAGKAQVLDFVRSAPARTRE